MDAVETAQADLQARFDSQATQLSDSQRALAEKRRELKGLTDRDAAAQLATNAGFLTLANTVETSALATKRIDELKLQAQEHSRAETASRNDLALQNRQSQRRVEHLAKSLQSAARALVY